MARLRTRVQLRERLRRDAQLRGQANYYDVDLNAIIQEAYDWVHEWLVTNAAEDYGVKTAMITATPGQSWIALPADFSDQGGMRILRRLVGNRLELVERSSRLREADDDPTSQIRRPPGVYWIEGPLSPVTHPSRIELRPVPSGAEQLEITYVAQAPQFGDDVTTLDVFSEHVERALIDLARTRALARGDGVAQNQAEMRMGQALAGLQTIRGKRDSHAPNWVRNHQRRGQRAW